MLFHSIGTVLLVGWGECASIYTIFSSSFKTLHSILIIHLTLCILPYLFSILYLLNKTFSASCNNWGFSYKSQWAKFAVSIFQDIFFFFKSWFLIQGYLGDIQKKECQILQPPLFYFLGENILSFLEGERNSISGFFLQIWCWLPSRANILKIPSPPQRGRKKKFDWDSTLEDWLMVSLFCSLSV